MSDRMMRAAAVLAFWTLFGAAQAAANDFMHQNCMRNADNQYQRCMDSADRSAGSNPNSFFHEQARRRCETARGRSRSQCDAALERRERTRPNNANRR